MINRYKRVRGQLQKHFPNVCLQGADLKTFEVSGGQHETGRLIIISAWLKMLEEKNMDLFPFLENLEKDLASKKPSSPSTLDVQCRISAIDAGYPGDKMREMTALSRPEVKQILDL